MKKSLLALAALSTIAGVAQAQSSVTLYGTLDAGVAYQTNQDAAGSAGLNSANSGYRQSNRFGVKGTEVIGNGLNANFDLEMGLNTTTGQANGMSATDNQFFNRQSWIGLSTASTEVRLGRDYHQNFKTIALYDTMEYYYTGIAPTAALLGSRLNNNLSIAQKIGNLTVGADYALNGGTANNYTSLGGNSVSATQGNSYGVSVRYDDGKLQVGAAYSVISGDQYMYNLQTTTSLNTSGTAATPTATLSGPTNQQNAWTVGAAYTMGTVKLSAGYFNQKDQIATTAQTVAWGGAKVALSPKVDVRAAYYQTNTTTSAAATGTTGLWIAALDYKLSPRTTLYVEADQLNYSGANIPTSTQTTQSRVGFGMGHTF